MSYTPTNWATGDVITADKLNNIEQGIVNAGGVTVVTFSASQDDPYNPTSSHTYQEIKAILDSGGTMIGTFGFSSLPQLIVGTSDGNGYFEFQGYSINGQNKLMCTKVTVREVGGISAAYSMYSMTSTS